MSALASTMSVFSRSSEGICWWRSVFVKQEKKKIKVCRDGWHRLPSTGLSLLLNHSFKLKSTGTAEPLFCFVPPARRPSSSKPPRPTPSPSSPSRQGLRANHPPPRTSHANVPRRAGRATEIKKYLPTLFCVWTHSLSVRLVVWLQQVLAAKLTPRFVRRLTPELI